MALRISVIVLFHLLTWMLPFMALFAFRLMLWPVTAATLLETFALSWVSLFQHFASMLS